MSWRLAHSLEVLRAEVDALAPKRNKASDGTIGDARHAANPNSDHNPFIKDANGMGVVRALDVTHDPGGGLDANRLAEHVRRLGSRGDKRVGYVIWNRKIASAIADWTWRPYTGENPHDKHVHISVSKESRLFDSRAAWDYRKAAAGASDGRDKPPRRKGDRDGRRKQAKKQRQKPERERPRLSSLIAHFRDLEEEQERAWDRLVAYGGRKGRLAARARSRDVATILLRIEAKLTTLFEQDEEEAEPALSVTVPSHAAATTGVTAAAGPALPGAAAPAKGSAPPASTGNGPADAQPRGSRFEELSDTELGEHIEKLARQLERTRAALIGRYVRVEREFAKPAPARRLPVERPAPARRLPGERPTRTAAEDEQPKREGPWRSTKATPDEIRSLQRRLNAFTDRHLKYLGPILVDGVKGPSTRKRIETAKFYLGYTGKEQKSPVVTPEFLRRLGRPRSVRSSNTAMLARAMRRRRRQHKNARRSAAPHAGVANFDNKQVASWIVPHLNWARREGWTGAVVSGFRTPEYSEQICIDKCGAPTCPGRCAGRSSNHSGRVSPSGAVDVTQYAQFAELMKRSPHSPRILNVLGPADPGHFSASGR